MEKNENGYPLNQRSNLLSHELRGIEDIDSKNQENENSILEENLDLTNEKAGSDSTDKNERFNADKKDNLNVGERRSFQNRIREAEEQNEDCLNSRPLAYVYAPNQKFRMLYSAEDALNHGTLFEELFKPWEVYGHE